MVLKLHWDRISNAYDTMKSFNEITIKKNGVSFYYERAGTYYQFAWGTKNIEIDFFEVKKVDLYIRNSFHSSYKNFRVNKDYLQFDTYQINGTKFQDRNGYYLDNVILVLYTSNMSVNISNEEKEIVSTFANINGEKKEIVKVFYNINGELKEG